MHGAGAARAQDATSPGARHAQGSQPGGSRSSSGTAALRLPTPWNPRAVPLQPGGPETREQSCGMPPVPLTLSPHCAGSPPSAWRGLGSQRRPGTLRQAGKAAPSSPPLPAPSPPPAPARRSGLAWEGAPGEGVGRRGPACSGSSARLEVSSGAAAQGPSAPRAQGRLNPGPAVRVGARRPRGCDPASGQAAPRLRCVAADTAWGVLRSWMGGCGRGGADRRLGAGERKAGGRE